MNNHPSNLLVLAPQTTELTGCIELPPLVPFAAEVLSFLQALSKRLLTHNSAESNPELVALGFWLRSAHIKQLSTHRPADLHKALGLVLHFTPANVDTMFVYSWVCSLLMGNHNIVRVASSDSSSKAALLSILNELFALPEHQQISLRNAFVNYPKESDFSAQLSLRADARVIWGGDNSVNTIRSLPTKPRCRDVSFADRYSAAVINGDALTNSAAIQELAELLWRDTQAHAQQACSSPRIIYWLGSERHQHALCKQLNTLALKSEMDLAHLNNHLVVSQLIQSKGAKSKLLVREAVCVLAVDTLNSEFIDWQLGGGFFLLRQLKNLEQLAEHADNKLQTLSYWNVDKNSLLKLLQQPSITGIDRVVPVGRALDFSPTWDGFDLFSQLCRKIILE